MIDGIERVTTSTAEVRTTFGVLRVSASLRNGRWYAAALDRADFAIVGEGSGSDEWEAIAAALHDAKKSAKRVLRALRDPRAVELLGRVD